MSKKEIEDNIDNTMPVRKIYQARKKAFRENIHSTNYKVNTCYCITHKQYKTENPYKKQVTNVQK